LDNLADENFCQLEVTDWKFSVSSKEDFREDSDFSPILRQDSQAFFVTKHRRARALEIPEIIRSVLQQDWQVYNDTNSKRKENEMKTPISRHFYKKRKSSRAQDNSICGEEQHRNK